MMNNNKKHFNNLNCNKLKNYSQINNCPLNNLIISNRNNNLTRDINPKSSRISLNTNSITDSNVTKITKSTYDSRSAVSPSISSNRSDKDSKDKKKERELTFQQWLAEKNLQKQKERKIREEYEKALLMEKEHRLEQGKQIFATWLESKKKQKEMQQKLIEEKKDNEDRVKEEKEKREKLVENAFKLWLKRKEKDILKKKMQTQVNKIQTAREERNRMQDNLVAFDKWKNNSKCRPKPANQGLDNSNTYMYISFINPVPWIPNI